MRPIFMVFLLLAIGPATAENDYPQVSVKERLRILLWTEGLDPKPQASELEEAQSQELPEELERPLRKNS